MSPEAMRVSAVLDDICRESGVSPADPTEEAGRALHAAILAHPLLPPAHDVVCCPLAELVRRLSRVPHLVVTTERVLLTRVGGAERRIAGRAEFRRESVMLPPAIRSAVAQLDAPGGLSRRAA